MTQAVCQLQLALGVTLTNWPSFQEIILTAVAINTALFLVADFQAFGQYNRGAIRGVVNLSCN